MGERLELQAKLQTLLGSSNVYYQPPETVKLTYPCIIYSLSSIAVNHADNREYKRVRKYDVTLIHKDPDNAILDELAIFPYCSFDRHYISNGLHHYVYTLFY